MKIYPLALMLLIIVVSCSPRLEITDRITSWNKLSSSFADPPASYRSIPFWAWNGEITEKMIERELSDFRSHGFGGVIVHPRYGMLTPYLSDEYFDLVGYTVEQADRHGMYVWLYDENNYPSGFAGGHVPAQMPESYNEGTMLRLVRQQQLQPDSSALYPVVLKKSGNRFFDITADLNSEKGKWGEYYLYEKAYPSKSNWFAGYSYVDLLKPGVSEKFIELTMPGYEKVAGKAFGKTVPGIFTDEPHISPDGQGLLIRWTPDLFDRFRERWGYDLETVLPMLSLNTGNFRQVRYDYFKLLLELFIERWSVPWNTYTESSGLLWTGHYWEHTWPDPYHGSDNMAMAAWHQLPGIDMLFNNRERRPDQFGNIRCVKELSSIANQMGRTRTLSETYGGSGWELSFADMKRNGDWEYVLGVNLLNQHLSYVTITGDRKHDYPQSFTAHEPWWDEYTGLADYFARLSLALSSGKQVNHILVLEPTSTGWMYTGAEDQRERFGRIDSDFRELLGLLESSQAEYDLGSEEIILRFGNIEEGMLQIGEAAYQLIILPSCMENLSSGVAEMLQDYLASGGYLVSMGSMPLFIDGLESQVCTSWLSSYPQNIVQLTGNTDPRLNELTVSEEFSVVASEGGVFYHQRRELNDGQILFLVNTDKEKESMSRWYMTGRDLLELDPFTGKISAHPCVQSENMLSFSVTLPPSGSKLLFVSDREIRRKSPPEVPFNSGETELPLTGFNVKEIAQNVLPIDYCILNCESIRDDTCYYYEASRKVFIEYGFPGNPWSSSIQYKDTILKQNRFGRGTGFKAVYLFNTDSLPGNTELKMALEHPEYYTVVFNGHFLDPEKGEHWLDEQIGMFDLTGMVQDGENRFEIRVEPMNLLCELAPVYLLGDFCLEPALTGWTVIPPAVPGTGSWREQGYPYYSGYVDYSATMICSKVSRQVLLHSGPWKGTVAAVMVNGKKVGQLYESNDVIRLDPFLVQGSNVISMRVYGSLKNLLGPHHGKLTEGYVSPSDFRRAPEQMPPGEAYDLLDYGLYEPFRITGGN